jgi:hypothetical protein
VRIDPGYGRESGRHEARLTSEEQMAIVRKLEPFPDLIDARHTEVRGTYSVVTDANGNRWLQIDTYGSAMRKHRGKKSQSIRFSPEAIRQLRAILARDV